MVAFVVGLPVCDCTVEDMALGKFVMKVDGL